MKIDRKKLTWAEKEVLSANVEYRQLLQALASEDSVTRHNAFKAIAAELGPVIREGVMDGDNVSMIFNPTPVGPGAIEYPLHFLAPGTEKDYVAYTIPRTGEIPTKNVQGDRIFLNTYWVGNSIEVDLPYVRDAQWNVVTDIMGLLEAGLVKKMNDDGWHTILGAGLDRGILVFDGDASAGQFSRKLISLLKIAMVRNGGGNMGSLNRARLTDVYLSHEALEDIRNWGSGDGGDVTRDRFVVDPQGAVESIYGVKLHPMDELGVGQEYQDYWTTTLGGTMGASDQEVGCALDLSRPNAFVMPVRQAPSVMEDPNAFLANKMRWLVRQEHGLAILDSRSTLIFSF